MARPSYGPAAKQRAQQLLAVLLAYANEELDLSDADWATLNPHLQIHWQTEQRLIVRTKVRYLEVLAHHSLTASQIKEALHRFQDFLEILEDNRPNKGGSEVWHFTLSLWHRRIDWTANLTRLDQEWEHRRPEKSKLATQRQEASDPPEDLWWQYCQTHLELHHYQRLTTNPLTFNAGITFNLQDIYLPLGLVERYRPDPRDLNGSVDDLETYMSLSLADFYQRLQATERQRIAIVGEPGAGKTTLLQQIAHWLLDQQALPIWISLADLHNFALADYILHDWIPQVTRSLKSSSEQQDSLVQQVQSGRVWLLLDGLDEMAMTAATALTRLTAELRGWLADAHVILTCRSNVWDSGKNTLETFSTFYNLTFNSTKQMGLFIDRWFPSQPDFSLQLQHVLNQPKHKRIKDAVKNPLRLALLCRSWFLCRGTLPSTQALLYQQFVEAFYEWKQDRFPTTAVQRHQLNRLLGQVAFHALLQPDIRFRLPQVFVETGFHDSLDLMDLALQLGWLHKVGISTTTGEKIYAFYHSTFQEYFAALAISDGAFFLDLTYAVPILSPQWREVFLLWLGRPDIQSSDKETLIEQLIRFKDGCGGFYDYQVYCLAAVGLGEYPQCRQASVILNQIIQWRYGSVPSPVAEAARVALVQTDRTLATTALEFFIWNTKDPFIRWQAAYTLGKTLDPGHATAIMVLSQLMTSLQSEGLRLQVIESLGRIDPEHPTVIQSLNEILNSTQQPSIRRRAAYSLGKLNPTHPQAISTLEALINSTEPDSIQIQAAESLLAINPNNAIAQTRLQAKPADKTIPSRLPKHPKLGTQPPDLAQRIASLETRLQTVDNPMDQRRFAYQLATLEPGHPHAIACLVQLLVSQKSSKLHKRVVEDLKEVLLDHQLPAIVTQLKPLIMAIDLEKRPSEDSNHCYQCYKLVWYCAQQLPLTTFFAAWQGEA